MQTVYKIIEQFREETVTPVKTELVLFTHKRELPKFKPATIYERNTLNL